MSRPIAADGTADGAADDAANEATNEAAAALEAAVRTDRPRLMGALVRRAGGDYVWAEEALAEACADAVAQWPRTGVPIKPSAWLATAANRRLVDGHRRAERRQETDSIDAEVTQESSSMRDARLDFGSDDDTLRLVFTSCHPALAPATRVALTLNAVSGLDSRAIARAFCVDESAMAKRLTRAKSKIRDAGIRFRAPAPNEIPDRLPDVLKAIELVFNEGYARAGGVDLDAPDLAREALHLARELCRLMPDETEPAGLLALILFTGARRDARVGSDGELVVLEDQDRSLWDSASIAEGRTLLAHTVRDGGAGPYVLRAALAGEHSCARSFEETRWARIVDLYDALLEFEPSPVIALNRAVALGESEGADAMVTALEAIEGLEESHYLHVARGEALRRLGRTDDAAAAFDRALELVSNAKERAAIERRAGRV